MGAGEPKDEKEEEPAKGSDWVTMEAKPREVVALVQPRAAPKHYNAIEQVSFPRAHPVPESRIVHVPRLFKSSLCHAHSGLPM